MQEMMTDLSAIAREAGQAILEVYEREDFDIETKGDDSPLTAADLASNKVIIDGLSANWPEIPILSEESAAIAFEERQTWSRYFLVDPLDGTKEFINRNGEFTVNIALIEDGVPIRGIVYVPVLDRLYAGASVGGQSEAFVEEAGARTPIRARGIHPDAPLIVVASRRHGGDALESLMTELGKRFNEIDTRNMGSSLKLCLVAQGEADLYPRLAPTSEWDTAAAHAVVLAAGGEVVDTKLRSLRYNTKESVLNPFFYVIADPAFDWASVLSNVAEPS